LDARGVRIFASRLQIGRLRGRGWMFAPDTWTAAPRQDGPDLAVHDGQPLGFSASSSRGDSRSRSRAAWAQARFLPANRVISRMNIVLAPHRSGIREQERRSTFR